jgi:hypothetical protein
VPPYLGVPSESHQFPVGVVGAEAVAVVDAVDVGMVAVVVDVIIVVVVVGDKLVVVEVFVLVDVEQDANTNDITIRMVSAIQMTPLFI